MASADLVNDHDHLLSRAALILPACSPLSRPLRAACGGAREDARSPDSGCARWCWARYARDQAGLRGSTNMALQVAELSIQLIETLQPLMSRIKAKDKALEDQIRRAASSIALNLGEAEFSDPGNRRARFHTAAGSAGETRNALRVAVAWRLVVPAEAEPAQQLLRRIIAALWKLTRG
jgi:four helix bundle protein